MGLTGSPSIIFLKLLIKTTHTLQRKGKLADSAEEARGIAQSHKLFLNIPFPGSFSPAHAAPPPTLDSEKYIYREFS